MSNEWKTEVTCLEKLKHQLYEAVSYEDHDEMAMLLRNAKFDVINSEDSSESLLDVATSQSDHIAVELLLAHGAVPDYKRPKHIWLESTLSRAIMSGNLKTIQLLVNQGCDPDTKFDNFNEDDFPREKLKFPQPICFNYWYIVIGFDNLPDFQLLLECKGRKIIDDQWSQNMLMLACSFGSLAVIGYLLDQGVSTESIDKNGWTCLFYAMANWNVSVVELLLARGANIKHKDLKGLTVLHIAVIYRNEKFSFLHDEMKIIKTLIDQGADINATDINGLTPINTFYSDKGFVRDLTMIWGLLSLSNIDLAKPDINGVTPLHRAVSFNYLYIHANILYALNVDINARDNEGKTPLQSIDNFEAMVQNIRFLLEHGANSEGLFYYSKNGWLEKKKLLEMLEIYRLKRKVANLSNDQNIDTILPRNCVFSEETRNRLEEKFSKEIGRMKETILCDKLTYYDFLHAKKRALIKVAKRPEMRDIFTKSKHGFYKYGIMLCKNYLSGERPLTSIESEAMNNAEENLNTIFNNKLPNLVLYEIKKYIEIEDMIILDNMNFFSSNDNKNNVN